jgi:hypothetical protein
MGSDASTFSRINYVPLVKRKATNYRQSASTISALVDSKSEIVYACIDLKEHMKVSDLLAIKHKLARDVVYKETTDALWMIGTINCKESLIDDLIIKNVVIKNMKVYAEKLEATAIRFRTLRNNQPPKHVRLECNFEVLKYRSKMPDKLVQDLVKCGTKSQRVTRKTRKKIGGASVITAAAATAAAIR